MPVTKLTTQLISEFQCPPDKRQIQLCDSELPGLLIEKRSASQTATYYFRSKGGVDRKKTTYQKLGLASDITLAEARVLAKIIRSEVALGRDFKAERQASKAVLTFSDYFENHYLPHVKPRKRSWKRDEELYRLRIKSAIGSTKLPALSKHQIQMLHSALLDEGLAPATCNHHVKLIKHALNLAVEWDMLEKNPVSKFKLLPEHNLVNNYMNEVELQRFLHVLKTDSNRNVCRIAMFLLCTGARVAEALNAKWTNIDLENKTWIIPVLDSKSRRQRTVPLSDVALDVLRVVGTQGKFEHVFVNPSTKDRYTTIAKVFCRLRAAAGLKRLRLHDLRHQAASMLIAQGKSLYCVQVLLGHSSVQTSLRYAHIAPEEMLRAVNGNSDIIKKAMEDSSKSLQDAANSASIAIQGATKKEPA